MTMTREQFKVRQLKDKRALSAQTRQVLICAGTGCIAGGSLHIYDYMKTACQERGIAVRVGLLHEDGQVETPASGKELQLKILLKQKYSTPKQLLLPLKV